MPKKRRKRNKHWSYNAGERGRNWVRAFQQSRDGKFYLEWREGGRRRAVLLKGVTTPDGAKRKADELAAGYAGLETQPDPVTLAALFKNYLKEVTPTKKSKESRRYDAKAARLWLRFFDSQPEADRRSDRRPSTLDRVDWDRFVAVRARGFADWGPVKSRSVQRDLKWLIAVLNWAVGASMLTSSPWRNEVRRAQRWVMPRERNPKRPGMPAEIREGLIAYASNWQFVAMLILERETRRRNNAIRQLRWSDVDQVAWTVLWRGEADKVGKETLTPLTAVAIEVLKGLPSRGIGNAPVFPSARDPNRPTPQDTCQTWLGGAKHAWLKATPVDARDALRASLHRVGFHSELRSGVRDPEFRRLPSKVQEELSGKTYGMLTSTYDEVTVSDMRDEGRAIGIPEVG